MTQFGRVEAPYWDDAPAIVVGMGASLKGFDLGRLRGLGHVLAVKNSVWDMPWADACFGLDLPWIKREHLALEQLARMMPLYLAVPDQKPPIHQDVAGAIFLRRDVKCGPLSLLPEIIESGQNSGFGGFNLAVLKRPKLIYLFGFDYIAGEHYDQTHYAHQSVGDYNARYWPRWAKNFNASLPSLAKLGIEVVNASPRSAVTAFKKVAIEQAVEHLDRLRSERERGLCRDQTLHQATADGAAPG